MKSISFKSTMPTVITSITRFTTAALLLVALVACNSGGGGGGGSAPITGKSTSLKPTELAATGFYQGIDLTWKNAIGADRYTVYYSKASFKKTTASGVGSKTGITTTSASINGLDNGTKYYLRVEAINAKEKTKKLSTEEVSTTTNLQPPTNLKATGVYKGVDLSWEESKGATSYKVYYHTGSFKNTYDNGVQNKTVPTLTTSYSITGLENGKTYFLRVKAINDKVETKLSKQVLAKAIIQSPPNFGATGVNRAIDISWDAVKYASSYTIYYREGSDFDSTSDSTTDSVIQKETVALPNTKTTITGLINGKTYYLRAVTNYQTESSRLSDPVMVTVNLQPPTNLKATGFDQAVALSWNAVTGAGSYKVYYHTKSFSNTAGLSVKTVESSALDTSIEGLDNGTTYYLRVEVINAEGKKRLSTEEVSATPTAKLLTLRQSAAASIISPAAVDLSWDALAVVTGYKVYYAKVSLDDLNGGYSNFNSVGGKVKTITDTSATSITIGDLSVDTTYYFVVAANYKGGKEAAAPEVSADSSYIAELAIGGFHSCVRLNTGGIKCWGNNEFGQLGVDNTTDRHTATSMPGILAKQLSAGYRYSCAINLEDKLYCWGANWGYELGLSGGNRSSPTLVGQDKLDKVSLVTAGARSTCALAAGKNYCWGHQEFGLLGNGVSSDDLTMDAQEINDITPDVKQFALGWDSGCAIDANDVLWCWGNNKNGQVGDDTTTDRSSPVRPELKGSSKATTLAGKSYHYCVVDDANKVQCWGNNSYWQLGIDVDSTSDYSNIPRYVITSKGPTSDLSPDHHLIDVSKVVVGGSYSCALIIGGSVRCWGRDNPGVVGNYNKNSPTADTDMPGINNAIDIAAGWYHTCVLLADRASVKCWGINSYGQLGNGFDKWNSNITTPVAVKGL